MAQTLRLTKDLFSQFLAMLVLGFGLLVGGRRACVQRSCVRYLATRRWLRPLLCKCQICANMVSVSSHMPRSCAIAGGSFPLLRRPRWVGAATRHGVPGAFDGCRSQYLSRLETLGLGSGGAGCPGGWSGLACAARRGHACLRQEASAGKKKKMVKQIKNSLG